MPTYEFGCEACQVEWEEICQSWRDPYPPCPECQGPSKKLISLCAPGKVELTGFDLKESIKQEAARDVREASMNENKLANMVGENRFQSNVTSYETIAKNPKSKVKRLRP